MRRAIRRRLRVLRADRQLTQRELARQAGMTVLRYWEIENGYRRPEAADLAKLARVLGCAPTDIVPEEKSR